MSNKTPSFSSSGTVEQSVELHFGCFITRTLLSIDFVLVSFYVFSTSLTATILAIFPVTKSVVSPRVSKLSTLVSNSFSCQAQFSRPLPRSCRQRSSERSQNPPPGRGACRGDAWCQARCPRCPPAGRRALGYLCLHGILTGQAGRGESKPFPCTSAPPTCI